MATFQDYCEKLIEKAAQEYLETATRVIEEDLAWAGFEGRVTFRKSGEVATFPRNIVDTGNLRDSSATDRKAWDRVDVSWDGNGETPPVEVHEGRRTKRGYIPGRPWTDVARQRFENRV